MAVTGNWAASQVGTVWWIHVAVTGYWSVSELGTVRLALMTVTGYWAVSELGAMRLLLMAVTGYWQYLRCGVFCVLVFFRYTKVLVPVTGKGCYRTLQDLIERTQKVVEVLRITTDEG
ncbi:hypothetical protein NDU88_000536 [Pleurodeles waltl]|uniref:Uncharacterized protein n=1 Tax=Pleurodeles waltl TaxID=8319 RepID=A0AAV7V5C9_PLEWA|nr:hypothetical protein NDU88_000536 [Pleurodeles waltl]